MSYNSYIGMDVHLYVPKPGGGFETESIPTYMVEQLEEDLMGCGVFDYGDVEHGFSGEVNYDYYIDEIRKVSEKYPDVLFSLSRSGEDNRDLSEEYFLGGGYQWCPAIISYEAFDTSKLDGGKVPEYKPETEIDVGDFV